MSKPKPNRPITNLFDWVLVRAPYPAEIRAVIETVNKVGDRVTMVRVHKRNGQIHLTFGSGRTYISGDVAGLSE